VQVETPSIFASHDAKQSSALALISVPRTLDETAIVSQMSSKPSYDTWSESPCAQALAMERRVVQDAADEEDVEAETVLLEVGASVEGDAQLPETTGGGSPPAPIIKEREPG
jgi:hypothetical protein